VEWIKSSELDERIVGIQSEQTAMVGVSRRNQAALIYYINFDSSISKKYHIDVSKNTIA
jgi:hypothetical protein